MRRSNRAGYKSASQLKLEAITNWQAITNWKDNRAPRGFDGRDGNGCSGN
jgi:hypothetical protein